MCMARGKTVHIDELTIKTMRKIGSSGSFLGLALKEVMSDDSDVYILVADVCRYSGLSKVKELFPDRVINVGIAEQDMIGIAAGLALQGAKVYVVTYASFVVLRAMEQVRHNASVLGLNLIIVGINAGYSMENLGISHWSTEDIAMTRCLPNMKVVCPSDNLEAYKVGIESGKTKGPMYVRLSGVRDDPIVYEKDYEYSLGKIIVLRDGEDALILSHGSMVNESLKAADLLKENGIGAAVADVHTVKPLDTEYLDIVIQRYRMIFVVEEHNIIGGLGTAVSEYLAEKGCGIRIVRLGMRDEIYYPGSRKYIWQQAGICDYQIAEQIKRLIGRWDNG